MVNVTPKQFYEENGSIKISFEKDNTLKRNEMKEVLTNLLGDGFENIDFKKGQRNLTGHYKTDQNDIFFMMANVTFMGGTEGQHPKDLKRIQYNVDWRTFYNTYKDKGTVLWMGIYSYKDLNVFAVFEPETYLEKHKGKEMKTKKGQKSAYSCHIYLNDLYQGYKNGIFKKIDKNGNHIWAISSDNLKRYFNGNYEQDPIVSTIKEINNEKISWNRWIRADEAIPFLKELKSKTGFNKWKENMWNGFILEGIYNDYLKDNPSKFIEYVETSEIEQIKKDYKKYCLDLAFPSETNKFIGDLKNVCVDGYDAYLNDESNVNEALKKFNKIWFIIYLHEKKPGKTNNYEMVKWRNHFIKDEGEWNKGKKFNEKSAPGTPHSIKMVEMVIVELNEVTKDKYFSIRSQGKNSNDKDRPDKYNIKKKILKEIVDDSFVIYREKHS